MEVIAERGKSIEVTDTRTAAASGKRLWVGRIMSGLAILFLAFDAVAKLLRLPPVLEGTAKLGYPVSVVFGLGTVLPPLRHPVCDSTPLPYSELSC